MLETTCPTTWCHIPKDLNQQRHWQLKISPGSISIIRQIKQKKLHTQFWPLSSGLPHNKMFLTCPTRQAHFLHSIWQWKQFHLLKWWHGDKTVSKERSYSSKHITFRNNKTLLYYRLFSNRVGLIISLGVIAAPHDRHSPQTTFFYDFTLLVHTVSELVIKQTKNILQLEGVQEKWESPDNGNVVLCLC